MKYTDIRKPIGLYTPCREIENTCAKAQVYRRCGLRPRHLILPLDPGCGRTTFVEYMVRRYKDAGVLDFTGGLDDFIEIVFDGTLPQLRQAFAQIDAAAVYTNEYRNIISMELSSLACHLGEIQCTEFLKNCRRVSEHACVVFFVQSTPSRNEEKLLQRLTETVDNIRRLTVEPYTKEDLCDLIGKTLTEHGLEIRHVPLFRPVLLEILHQASVANVQQALSLAETLVEFADFSGFVPFVDENSLKAMQAAERGQTERSGMK